MHSMLRLTALCLIGCVVATHCAVTSTPKPVEGRFIGPLIAGLQQQFAAQQAGHKQYAESQASNSAAQASSAQAAQMQKLNVQGFHNKEGFNHREGFNHASEHAYENGAAQNANAFNTQAGAAGNAHGTQIQSSSNVGAVHL